jgi:hypothetical protein
MVRKNTIRKVGKHIETVGASALPLGADVEPSDADQQTETQETKVSARAARYVSDDATAVTLTPDQPHSVTAGRGPSIRGPPDSAIYISAPQVALRYGGVSHMWLERRLKADPTFPRPSKFGRWRFFKIEELIAWERKAAAKSRAA